MYDILKRDPALLAYSRYINAQMERYEATRAALINSLPQSETTALPQGEAPECPQSETPALPQSHSSNTPAKASLSDFANAHEYYGFHRTADGWVYREWAPAAESVCLMGDFNDWNQTSHPLTRIENGNWEIHLPADALHNGSRVRAYVTHDGQSTPHVPLYARRVVQAEVTFDWLCEVWDPAEPYPWTDADFTPAKTLFIYEAHVGMATEEYRIGSYREFADNVLPRVQKLGYNTIQLMAILEHPYYGSFGYQVSSFFAASSRFGYPEELKYLVNKAHEMGITVLLDLVHSHAVRNTVEGINAFDGTEYQFFHDGPKGDHPAWGTKCFNYGKHEVLHFLLSNLKFWLSEYHFDGFRFDGVTSMLYLNHALGAAFTNMNMYFSDNTDVEAVTYLQLANELIREVKPHAITIAEDMSGMPGMCVPVKDGGIGFDYRLGMGLPDMWIKLIKEVRDENWNLDYIWHELIARMAPTVSYVESHDQALVGDQTILFRLAGARMYTDMDRATHNLVIDRATALHKMLRLLTMSAGGNAYLNFMGNEFGHPEWIDFPREGNDWSYHYCRRQWSLVENGFLKYGQLNAFDEGMIHLASENDILADPVVRQLYVHCDDHILAYERGGLTFVFNFHPSRAFTDYLIPVSQGVDHEVVFSSDDAAFGGFGNVAHQRYSAYVPGHEGPAVRLMLPPRTALVMKAVKAENKETEETKETE